MRVRIALHEKGIAFEVQEEDLKNFSEKLKTLHPEVKVPVLVDGNRVIYESAIITEYVNDLSSQTPSLMPLSAGEKAEVRLWTYWCNHEFKGAIDRFKYGIHRFSQEECIGAEERIQKHLSKLELHLKKREWLVGDSFSLAEINLFPFVRQLSRIQPTPAFLSTYSHVIGWMEKIATRTSVIEALKK
jgi:glutathione S-transferase